MIGPDFLLVLLLVLVLESVSPDGGSVSRAGAGGPNPRPEYVTTGRIREARGGLLLPQGVRVCVRFMIQVKPLSDEEVGTGW